MHGIKKKSYSTFLYTPMVIMRKWNYAAFKCNRKTYKLAGHYLDLPWIQVVNKIWKYTLKNKG